MQTTTTMDYFDYGPQPSVAAPPAATVTDMTSELVGSAAKTLSQLGC